MRLVIYMVFYVLLYWFTLLDEDGGSGFETARFLNCKLSQ